ncbi:Rv1355c family protein [Mycolicibacterium sp. BiH015]|uniref:Rv1355c family protein n=1 Tax=Mycolicibacterium sp. BiH015 TaxID=3018808 RepID=UPI0022E05D6C|nr:Rv1355c family protein [Mycolicibacterium sp. BiH015]MDA2895329.1 Rv1355c family protein [Mycolicibacterium sp. BiH015]
MTAADVHESTHRAVLLDATADAHEIARLRADGRIEFIDRLPEDDRDTLTALWAYYPWRRAAVRVLGPDVFQRVRLDRNRHLITDDELSRLSTLRVGVVGLSVGHAIAHALAAEGLCGELRLADFDDLELTNLNRVPASVFDIGVNKAVACARRIAELNPYLPVQVLSSGITAESIDAFLDDLDVVIEECDSLDVKVRVREGARTRRLPVLMATSSGGLLDVERFDEEPQRPVFHGLLGDVNAEHLASLSSKDKVPHVLRVIDAAVLRPRMQASLLEVGKTLSTWPQLSSEVAIGAATVAEAVRRLGLGETLHSGRVKVDVPAILDDIRDPMHGHFAPGGQTAGPPEAAPPATTPPTGDALTAIAAAAARAPSGGNTQPWTFDVGDDTLTIRVDPHLTSAMDIGFRGSAVAVGAATFNARVAAAAHGLTADVEYRRGDESSPLRAVVRIRSNGHSELANQFDAMLRRETNRHRGVRVDIAAEVVASLTHIAETEGARLRLITAAADIDGVASVLAEADRIRYLTPLLHSQMISELRWPGDPSPDTGIDIRSLELADADLAFLDILRSGAVMGHLADWNAGSALGEATRSALSNAAGVALLSVRGSELADYARGGSALEAVWIAAQEENLAVQPISPAFLYAREPRELDALSRAYSQQLADLQYSLETLFDIESDESPILILRLCRAPRPSVSSRRRQPPGRSTAT